MPKPVLSKQVGWAIGGIGAVFALTGIILFLAADKSTGMAVGGIVSLVIGLGATGAAIYLSPATRSTGPRLSANPYVCPNPKCAHVGPAKLKSRGSDGLIIVVLFFLGIIPGLLYAMFAGGTDLFCDKCGVFIVKR